MCDDKLKAMLLLFLFYVRLSAAARGQHLINIKSSGSAIRGINFRDTLYDVTFDHGIFLQVKVANEGDCALKCAATQNCFSYNFLSSKMCQLINKIRHGYGMTPSQGRSVYRGIKVNSLILYWLMKNLECHRTSEFPFVSLKNHDLSIRFLKSTRIN